MMTYNKAEDEGYLVAKRMIRNHERITERTGSILAREFADDYAYSDTPASPSRLKEAFLRGFDKGVEDAIEGRRDPKGRRPARKPAHKASTRGSGYYVGPTPSGRLYFYKTKSEARSAAKAMAKNMRRSVEIRMRGTSATKWKGRLVERVKPTAKGRGSRRDISRVDLKHLSGAALLKLLRQAIRKGDEDMAEVIGKELDRRGGGYKRRTGRDAQDDYEFDWRVVQAARRAKIVWKPAGMIAQQWPPRYAHVREAGGEFFVIAPGGDIAGVFKSLTMAVRKARGVDRLHLRTYGRR